MLVVLGGGIIVVGAFVAWGGMTGRLAAMIAALVGKPASWFQGGSTSSSSSSSSLGSDIGQDLTKWLSGGLP